jgi:phage recombination protein Bet
MWSSVAGKMIETVWPGISELRTTAFRTGQYASMPAPDFGPTIKGMAGRGKSKGQERSLTLHFPEWCRVTITRELNGKERSFVGPKVYWFEAYAKWADTDVPNEMWSSRPVGQLEKCAEAEALRRAFPEEIGNALTAEEMEGQHTIHGAAHAPEMPKPESVTRPRAGGERKPLPPLVSQPQFLTASSSAELPEPFAARQERDPEIPHALAHAPDQTGQVFEQGQRH